MVLLIPPSCHRRPAGSSERGAAESDSAVSEPAELCVTRRDRLGCPSSPRSPRLLAGGTQPRAPPRPSLTDLVTKLRHEGRRFAPEEPTRDSWLLPGLRKRRQQRTQPPCTQGSKTLATPPAETKPPARSPPSSRDREPSQPGSAGTAALVGSRAPSAPHRELSLRDPAG